MRIYIASSWKNQHAVMMLTSLLRDRGHEVMSFVENECEDHHGHVNNPELNFEEWIWSDDGEKKFRFDVDSAIGSNLVIYIGPSGTDAWAEVGAAWASGVPVIGLWAKGEPAGLMRRMVEWCKDFWQVLAFVDELATVRP